MGTESYILEDADWHVLLGWFLINLQSELVSALFADTYVMINLLRITDKF